MNILVSDCFMNLFLSLRFYRLNKQLFSLNTEFLKPITILKNGHDKNTAMGKFSVL